MEPGEVPGLVSRSRGSPLLPYPHRRHPLLGRSRLGRNELVPVERWVEGLRLAPGELALVSEKIEAGGICLSTLARDTVASAASPPMAHPSLVCGT